MKNIKYTDSLGQGKWVAEDVYDLKENGYFVEVGAYDGKDCSHTYPLEKYLNWKGICIEPSEEQWATLFKNRNCCVCGAVVWHTDNQEISFLSGEKNREAKMSSGIEGYALTDMTEKKKKEILENIVVNKKYTKTLYSILNAHNAPKFIEFLSLDAEGSEYEILKNFPFEEYIFGSILIERGIDKEKNKNIRLLLEKNQYIYNYKGKCDDYYLHITVKNSIDFRRKNKK